MEQEQRVVKVAGCDESWEEKARNLEAVLRLIKHSFGFTECLSCALWSLSSLSVSDPTDF